MKVKTLLLILSITQIPKKDKVTIFFFKLKQLKSGGGGGQTGEKERKEKTTDRYPLQTVKQKS